MHCTYNCEIYLDLITSNLAQWRARISFLQIILLGEVFPHSGRFPGLLRERGTGLWLKAQVTYIQPRIKWHFLTVKDKYLILSIFLKCINPRFWGESWGLQLQEAIRVGHGGESMNLWLCPSFLSCTSFTENITFVTSNTHNAFQLS